MVDKTPFKYLNISYYANIDILKSRTILLHKWIYLFSHMNGYIYDFYVTLTVS